MEKIEPIQLNSPVDTSFQHSELLKLFSLLPDVYFVVKGIDGRVLAANDVAVRLCGFETELDMIGKTDYDIFPKDRADTYVEDDRIVFETGESISDRVELAPDPDNSINWFVTTKVPLYGNAGRVIALACIARNMTAMHATLRPYVEMNEVLEYIRANYASAIKIDDLARVAHLSASQFERNFRKVFKISPKKHIQDVRIRAACNQLRSTNDTISTIAVDSGYYDHSHFAHCFKILMGVSPSEYRKKGKNIL